MSLRGIHMTVPTSNPRLQPRLLPVRRAPALVAAAASVLLITLATGVDAADSHAVAVPHAVSHGFDDNGNPWDSAYADGIQETAFCYNVLRTVDVVPVAPSATLQDDGPLADALVSMGGSGGARYLAGLGIGAVESTFVMNAVVIDTTQGLVIAREGGTGGSLEAMLDQAKALGREIGSRLPCTVTIDGVRRIDLSTSGIVQTGMRAPYLLMFNALSPLAVAAEPSLAGAVTQTDGLEMWPTVSVEDRSITGHTIWQAILDAPRVEMTAPEVDQVVQRAPSTLKFERDLTGTYDPDSRNAHFELEYTQQAKPTGGVGTCEITVKDVVQLTETVATLVNEAVLDPAAGATLQQSQAVALPMPNTPDEGAFFRLTFDINLRDDDLKTVTGTDAIGPFDYTVRVKREPDGSQ